MQLGVCTDGQQTLPELTAQLSHMMSMTVPSHKSLSQLKTAFANDVKNLR